ncbi:hypothetical protein M513_09046 [Trichuris suis]|uniref:GIY-YIG domain-containing protein n=1 Tax=Trichuris suis TaxID=68888 RepID=A0A085LYP0_9BILA|nr:hypothetical protein M513_09046 [Trichuris suis]
MWCRGGWTAVFEVFFGPGVSPEVSHVLRESVGHREAGFSNSVCYTRGPNLRSPLRSGKVRVSPEEHAGVVYEVRCSYSATYIGETSFSVTHRLSQHMRHLRRYTRAKEDLENGCPTTTTPHGRLSSVPPNVAMERALATSAVAEHAAHCSGSLQTRVICKESHWSRRRIKEALYIQHNECINRDTGIGTCDIWTGPRRTTDKDNMRFKNRRQIDPVVQMVLRDNQVEAANRDRRNSKLLERSNKDNRLLANLPNQKSQIAHSALEEEHKEVENK